MVSEGDLIEVEIREIRGDWAIVDYCGIKAVLQATEITWDVMTKLSDILGRMKVGDLVPVRVTKSQGDALGISMKRVGSNPWLDPPKVGDTFEAKIAMETEYGYFIPITTYCMALLLRTGSSSHKVGDSVKVEVSESRPELERVEVIEY